MTKEPPIDDHAVFALTRKTEPKPLLHANRIFEKNYTLIPCHSALESAHPIPRALQTVKEPPFKMRPA